MPDIDKLVRTMEEAQQAARLAEHAFLVSRGWSENGTYHGVTWWYREGADRESEPQRTAVIYALQDLERANRA